MRRHVLRSALSTVAISGAATLAGVFTLAPGAFATVDPTPTEAAPTPEPEPTVTPDAATPTPSVSTPTPSTTAPTPEATGKPAKAKALAADFGIQKFRIGVQIADGSWVPAGTSTAGSTFTITETGPEVVDGQGEPVASYTFTCKTTSASIETGTTSSFCNPDSPPQRKGTAAAAADADAAAAAAQGGVTVDPDEADDHGDLVFRAAPGSTVKITQLTAGANLVKTPAVATLQPCAGTVDFFPDFYCAGSYSAGTRLNTVLFANPGLPPVAVDDARTTKVDTPVDIDILTNDDTVNGAPLTGIEPITSPAHGTVIVKGSVDPAPAPTPTPTPTPTETQPTEIPIEPASVRAAATGPVFTYTPAKGFTGKDTFDYTLSTPNGTATATVTITIRDASDADVPTGDSSDGESGPLPDTGGVDGRLIGLGSLLLVGGAGLTVAARQRIRGRHVRIG